MSQRYDRPQPRHGDPPSLRGTLTFKCHIMDIMVWEIDAIELYTAGPAPTLYVCVRRCRYRHRNCMFSAPADG